MLTIENSDDELPRDKSLTDLNIKHTTILSCFLLFVFLIFSEE